MVLSIANGKNCSKEKAHKLYITLECMLEFEKEEEKEKILALMHRFSSATRYAYNRLLEGVAEKEIEKRVAEKHRLNARYVKGVVLITKQVLKSCLQRGQNPKNKMKNELKKEKSEYKKNALKERIKRLRKYLELLLSHTRDSGKSEPATQQAVNREMKPMRGRAKSLQKSWRVLSVALAVLLANTCLEWCRDHSPLKCVLISGDCVKVAGKGSPSLPGQGTAASNCSFMHFG
jgi:predicted transposase